MFWRILQWVQIVISLIREAEDKLGVGRGAEKRALVVAEATRELDALATATQIGGCSGEVLAEEAGNLIDAVVGLFNCFGVFARSARAAAATSPAPAPDPAPKVRARRE